MPGGCRAGGAPAAACWRRPRAAEVGRLPVAACRAGASRAGRRRRPGSVAQAGSTWRRAGRGLRVQGAGSVHGGGLASSRCVGLGKKVVEPTGLD